MGYITLEGVEITEEEITNRPWWKKPVFPILGLHQVKQTYLRVRKGIEAGNREYSGFTINELLDFILRNPVTSETRKLAKERGYC